MATATLKNASIFKGKETVVWTISEVIPAGPADISSDVLLDPGVYSATLYITSSITDGSATVVNAYLLDESGTQIDEKMGLTESDDTASTADIAMGNGADEKAIALSLGKPAVTLYPPVFHVIYGIRVYVVDGNASAADKMEIRLVTTRIG